MPPTGEAGNGRPPERGGPHPPDKRPDPLWGSFPLVELCVLAGLVVLAIGAVGQDPEKIAIGLGLASLGGLELSIREHFTGYRSHSTLLGGLIGILAATPLYFLAGLVLWQALAAGAVVGVAALLALRKVFRRASGGLSYRVGGLSG